MPDGEGRWPDERMWSALVVRKQEIPRLTAAAAILNTLCHPWHARWRQPSRRRSRRGHPSIAPTATHPQASHGHTHRPQPHAQLRPPPDAARRHPPPTATCPLLPRCPRVAHPAIADHASTAAAPVPQGAMPCHPPPPPPSAPRYPPTPRTAAPSPTTAPAGARCMEDGQRGQGGDAPCVPRQRATAEVRGRKGGGEGAPGGLERGGSSDRPAGMGCCCAAASSAGASPPPPSQSGGCAQPPAHALGSVGHAALQAREAGKAASLAAPTAAAVALFGFVLLVARAEGGGLSPCWSYPPGESAAGGGGALSRTTGPRRLRPESRCYWLNSGAHQGRTGKGGWGGGWVGPACRRMDQPGVARGPARQPMVCPQLLAWLTTNLLG